MKHAPTGDVAKVFEIYPPNIRRKLLALRQRILATAAATNGVGEIEENPEMG